MRAAFSDVQQAACFAAVLLVLLGAPAFVADLGVLDREDVYATVPVGAGPMTHIQRELFERDQPLDIAFIGSSFIWAGIDAPHVQRELTRALGREASVTVLGSSWPGLDRDYAYLRDLLAQRRVGLVVLQFPNRELPTDDPAVLYNRVSDEPHVQAFRFYRVGEMEGATAGLGMRYRAALYAGAVLGLPRHLLSLLRPNFMAASPYDATLGARLDKRGYYGAPYERFRPPPPIIEAEEMIFGRATSASFRFFDEPMPPYQMHFARRIASLLDEHEVPAVLLHVPQANEITSEVVEERMEWIDATGISATLVGVPPARLFAGFTHEETLRFFSSDHLNENGAIYFTRVVAPALLRVFEDVTAG